jgi:methyltransferase-like protein
MDLKESPGSFDYIICHGVYSWVPPAVQEGILEICARLLTPRGIAYISYNTYPGWHMRAMVRDMMRYHVSSAADPKTRVREARDFLAFLVGEVAESKTTYGAIVQEEAKLLGAASDTYLFHEQLEEFNQPVYFHEFAARLAAHGLQYLSEAQYSLFDVNLPAQVEAKLEEWTDDFIRREQYLDFLRNRLFRRSLLCRAGIRINRQMSPATVKDMHIAALGRPKSAQPDIQSDAVEEFEAPDGAKVTTNHPLVKAMLICAFENWPRPLPFAALCDLVSEKLRQAGSALVADADVLAEATLHCFLSNVVELHVQPPPFVLDVAERPVASPLARLQAAREQSRVTSLSHRSVELDVIDRVVLRRLDGEHDRPALLAELQDLVTRGVLVPHGAEQLPDDPAEVRAGLETLLELSLRRIAASAMLLK